ncbi:phosphatase PAP2 family protein [Streptomyces sp. SCA3-4]|uniref:phosphatase PAP2 family protein n=1 Tax=Streptomyces sichuanensis TaxID=2871810 RepID=UPI001CE2F5C6|nr:phosphatase PAP2 family protein [Streptomyces sichuanensis]MCA6095310.1 phosphatase PAP2 family protein [Streptomyces sichuanensis]
MAGLVTGDSMPVAGGESNPDVSLLYDINGMAKDAPHWADRAVEFIGEYGIVLGFAVLMVCAWWSIRRSADAPAGVAALLWAPLAAGIALLINIPIRGFVRRPRPFLDHPGLDVLVDGKKDFSFVSDHATLTMALGVGLFVANRKYGFIGIGLALLEGFCRVYMGVHYPTDVVGGLALGTAVALLLAPLAMMLLTPLARTVAGTRAARLVRSTRAPLPVVPAAGAVADDGDPSLSGRRSYRHDRDLAA